MSWPGGIHQQNIPLARLDVDTGDIGPGGMRRRVLRSIAMAIMTADEKADRNAVAERIIAELDEAGFAIVRKTAPGTPR